jgi:hypothetical protein
MFAFFSHLNEHTCNHKIHCRDAKPRMNNTYLIGRTVVAINGSIRNVYHSNWCTVQYSNRKLTSWNTFILRASTIHSGGNRMRPKWLFVSVQHNATEAGILIMRSMPPKRLTMCCTSCFSHQLRSVCSKIENIDTSARILDSWSLAKQKRWLYNRELDVVICLLVHCSKLAPVDEIAFVSY